MPIFLIKSSRFREYQQENLRLLRCPVGRKEILRFNASWVEPELRRQDLSGQEAVVCLGDKPFRRFAPIRMVRIQHMRDEGERIEFLIEVIGRPDARLNPDEFNGWFAAALERRVAMLLVMAEERAVPMSPPENGLEAWKASVDRVCRSDSSEYFESSVFLLPGRLRQEGSDMPVDNKGLQCGAIYRQRFYPYNPHLGKRKLEAMRYSVEYDRTELELIEVPQQVGSDGRQELVFRILVPGTANLRLLVMPFAERSSRLDLSFHAAAGQPVRPLAAQQRHVGHHVRTLFDTIERGGLLDDYELAVKTIETMFLLSPKDLYLQKRLAHLHHRHGEHRRACEVFELVGDTNLGPDDWLAYFVSACSSGIAVERLQEIVNHLPWDDLGDDEARLIGEQVASRGERDILKLLELLAYAITENFLETIWKPIRPRIKTADGILKAYQIMQGTHLESDSGAWQYLFERSKEENIVDQRIDEAMLSHGACLGEEPQGFRDVLERHIKRLVITGEFRKVEEILCQSWKCLSRGAFDNVRRAAVDMLLGESGVGDFDTRKRVAANLLVISADLALARGDLDFAVELVQRALENDPDYNEALQLRERVICALKNTDELRQIQEQRQEIRIKSLRDRLAGKKLVIVGLPEEKTWKEDLRRELALERIEWFTSSPGTRIKSDHLRSCIGSGTGAVVVMTNYLDHGSSNAAREECRRKNVPVAMVGHGTSMSSVVGALLRVLEQSSQDKG